MAQSHLRFLGAWILACLLTTPTWAQPAPTGPLVPLDPEGTTNQRLPVLVQGVGGQHLAVWADSRELFNPIHKVALVDDGGDRLGPQSSFEFSQTLIPGSLQGVRTASGAWVVAWSEQAEPPFRRFRGYHFSADLTDATPLNLARYPSESVPSLCADPAGFLLTGQLELPSTAGGTTIERFDNQGQPVGTRIGLGLEAQSFCHTTGGVLTVEEVGDQLTVRRFDNTGNPTASGSTEVPVGLASTLRVAVHEGGQLAVFTSNSALAFFDEDLQPTDFSLPISGPSVVGLEALDDDQYGVLFSPESPREGEGLQFSRFPVDVYDDQGNPIHNPLGDQWVLQGSWAQAPHVLDAQSIIQTSTGGWLMGFSNLPAIENTAAFVQRFEVDGPGTLAWAYGRHVVREAGGEVQIPIQRLGGTTGELVAQIQLPPTAPLTLVQAPVFPDGDSQERIAVLQVADNGVADDPRTFTLTLGEPGAAETLELVVLDDEALSPLRDRGNFPVSAPGTSDNQAPVIAVGPDGQMLVTWEAPETFGVAGRRLAADGSSLDAPFDFDALTAFDLAAVPTVEALDSGGFATAAVLQQTTPTGPSFGVFHWVLLGPDELSPALEPTPIGFTPNGAPLAMAEGRGQGILLAGEIDAGGDLITRSFDATGQPNTDEPTVVAPFPGADSALANQPDGSSLLLWRNASDGSGVGISGVALDSEGRPLGDTFVVPEQTEGLQGHPDVAPLPGGGFLAVWHTLPHPAATWRVVSRAFGRDGQPMGPEISISIASDRNHQNPRLAVSGSAAAVVWDAFSVDGANPRAELQILDLTGRPAGQPISLGDPTHEIDQVDVDANLAGDFTVVWRELDDGTGTSQSAVLGQRFAARAGCADDLYTLCLGGRFEVRLGWESPNLELGGVARTVPLTDDTGAFWFFDPDNLEVMLKVIDGRGTNGHFWIYFGALSDVRDTVSVADTLTGRTKVYRNPAGIQASVGDIQAFEELPTPPVVTPTGSLPKRARVNSANKSVVLDRFQVDVAWRSATDCNDPSCQGEGTAVQLTDDTLAFWFFGDQNLEMAVKMVDGRGVNGNFWVYFGALTNLGFDITITDLQTGAVRNYSNTLGEFGSRGDIEAFPSGG